MYNLLVTGEEGAWKKSFYSYDTERFLEHTDPLARLVADGALRPLKNDTRFEIAVLIRLGRWIERALNDTGITVSRALIEAKRDHVFEFSSGNSCLRVHYNKELKHPGPRYRGMSHYFGDHGRLRPGITIELLQNERRTRVVLVEVKLSSQKNYLKDGYEQALLYRAEYHEALTGWPKAIVVVSADDAIQGAPRREDDVVAISWQKWVPEIVLEGLLEAFYRERLAGSLLPNT